MESEPLLNKSAPFNSVPIEIIEEIFDIHVNINCASRLALMLTCGDWHHTAVSLARIWDNISIGDVGPYNNILPITILCRELHQFITIFNRIGGSRFDLYVQIPILAFDNAENEEIEFLTTKGWLNRCRSLTILGSNGQVSSSTTTLFQYESYEALRSLSIEYDRTTSSCETLIQGIVNRVEETNTQLEVLRLESNNDPHRERINLLDYPNMLGRLRLLSIDNMEEEMPWHSMISLNELSIKSNSPILNPVRYAGIPPSVRRLDIRVYPYASQILAAVYSHLTHLTVETWQMVSRESNIVYLPNLVSLSLCASPIHLKYLDAPHVDELTIDSHRYHRDRSFYPMFHEATIRPRILKLEHDSGPDQMARFLDAHDLWTKVEEIHLIVVNRVSGVSSKLYLALAGKEVYQRVFPVLKVLSILHPDHYHGRLEESEKCQMVQYLKAIVSSRGISPQLRPLQEAKIGWRRVDASLDYKEAENYWPVEWRSCIDAP